MSTSSQSIATRNNEDAAMSAATGSAGSLDQSSVIVNADDWGRDCATTDRTLDCFRSGAVSSLSAMVFMADSVRSAEIARTFGIDAALHLNFTTPYSAPHCPSKLKEHQREIARRLTTHRFAPALYHPSLTASFEYVVKTQLEEYERLYGAPAARFDGHHHMHLCANVQYQGLLPHGSIVRRNLSFERGEKHFLNRLYRRIQDRRLARHHRMADYFFDMHPIEPQTRLRRIFELAIRFDVEIETHPVRDEEFTFLINEQIQRCSSGVRIANGYTLRSHLTGLIEENLV